LRPLLSASQLSTFEDCKRRWAFEYIWGIPREPNEAARLGTAVHALLEKFSRYGLPPDRSTREGQIALKMLGVLPPPGVGYPEKRFYLSTPRHAFTGFIDLSYWDLTHGATIIDHKTTSDLKWAKTPEMLQNDTQALIYAAAACTAFRVDSARLLWNYGTTSSKPQSHVVETRIHLSHAISRFERIENVADEITELFNAQVNPFSLPPVVSSCEKYGGCPHRARCNLTTDQKVRSLMQQDQARSNGLMGQIDQAQAYIAGTPPAPVQMPAYQPPQSAPMAQGYYPDPNTPQYAQQPQQPQQYAQQPQQPAQYGQPGGYPQPSPQHAAPGGGYPQAPQYAPQGGGYPQQAPQHAPQGGSYPQQAYAPQGDYPQQQAPQYAPQGGGYAPQQQEVPQAAPQEHARRPSARRAVSPPNSPESAQQNLEQHTQAAQQEQAAERKRGRPPKMSKAELTLEQHAFLIGVAAGLQRGAAPQELRGYGQAAMQAFFEEFPPQG
jgi:hypothetical protein